MTTYNTKPKPRALLINFSDEEIAASNIPSIFPTYKNIGELQLSSVRLAEYDVVIALEPNSLSNFALGPHLVFIGGGSFAKVWPYDTSTAYNTLTHGESVATEFVIQDNLPEELAALAKEILLPIFQDKTRNAILTGIKASPPHIVQSIWEPLVSDADGKVLAGYMLRSPNEPAEQWYLPPEVTGGQLGKWLRILTNRWARVNPMTFSLSGDWREDPRWQSPAEREAQDKIVTATEKFRKLKMEHEKEIAALEVNREAERAKTEASHRLLLTAQGTALKNEVADTLSLLGFEVINADNAAEKGDLLEDLRVTTTLEDGINWIALVEVRGYKRGAQLSDLLRISGRFVKRYMQENNGATPNAAWYIVNHDTATDPGKRQPALSGNKKEVQTFAEDDNGLVVDTTTLFNLRVAVEDGTISAKKARKALIESTGFFSFSSAQKASQ